jgi:Icc-related predicted phosphoesterase
MIDKTKKLHITMLSDTHNNTHDAIMPEIPTDMTSVLIHAGDFSFMGKPTEIQDFIAWMSDQPHDHKLWIPGNHELSLEDFPYNIEVIDNESGATCIHNKEIEINGIKIFGSSMTPEFGNWAFMQSKTQAERYWRNAPDEVDLLVTHGPPRGILDENRAGEPCGCPSLLSYVERVKPKVHCFGHIHESYGSYTNEDTLFYNVSTMNIDYEIANDTVVIEW